MTTTFRPMDISKKFLSKEKLDCSLLCAEPFVSFRRHEKKGKERLQNEYTIKEIRLKTAHKYKNEHAGFSTPIIDTLKNRVARFKKLATLFVKCLLLPQVAPCTAVTA